MNNKKSTVSIIKSSRARAEDISETEVKTMVREAVVLAGGLDFIKEDQFVVIKPNLVSTRMFSGPVKPALMAISDAHKKKDQIPEFVNGITSDRRVVKAMVELVREKNPNGQVYIMENSGDGLTSRHLKQMGFTLENLPGVDRIIALGEDEPYRDLDSDKLVAVSAENQLYTKMPKWMRNRYYFDKTYYSADVIISMCCLKNHANAAVTGGIKNVGIGAKPHNVYAMSKKKSLSLTTINHMGVNIHHFIHDYYSAKPVHFVLTDGLQGLAYGPAALGAPSYDAAKMNMRLIMASRDAVAIDTVHSCIVGMDPEKVNYIKDLSDDGFGVMDTSRIDIVGNVRVDEVKKRFPLPSGFSGGVLSLATGDVKSRWYDDYDGPESSMTDVKIKKSILTADLEVADKAIKIELFLDDIKVGTFTESFTHLECSLDNQPDEGEHIVSILVYDRLLNCSRTEENIIVEKSAKKELAQIE